jgi:hypothetical protein
VVSIEKDSKKKNNKNKTGERENNLLEDNIFFQVIIQQIYIPGNTLPFSLGSCYRDITRVFYKKVKTLITRHGGYP